MGNKIEEKIIACWESVHSARVELYIKEKNNELIKDFEFIFKDEELSELAVGKCKHLLIL